MARKEIEAMHHRLKDARKCLHLSQEFVARQMHLSVPTIVAIESGQREVTAQELAGFSRLYGIGTEESVLGTVSDGGRFSGTEAELSGTDRKEIMRLINFQRRYSETKKRA